MREYQSVQAFIKVYPGIAQAAPSVDSGFPWWLQLQHFLNMLLNGAPVSVLHGAPLRLRCENELGFKMVKWIAAIEFAHDFADLGAGQGGYNEDHEFYGYRMPI